MSGQITLAEAFGGGDQKPVFLLKSGNFIIPVLYMDEQVLVIDKPAGLVVYHPSGADGPSLAAAVREYVQTDDSERDGIVHRLDKDTSGVMIIARTHSAAMFLKHEFTARQVDKTYLALVEGHPQLSRAKLDLPIRRSLKYPTMMQIHPSGRSAQSEYRVISEYEPYSLLQLEIFTGRTHQIRVQMAHIGHSVVGDVVYGLHRRPAGLARQWLHAYALTIALPNGNRQRFVSSLPVDLRDFLEGLS